MKKVLLILFAIIIGINLNTQAEDFSAVNNGATIYYEITSSSYPYSVSVSYRGSSEYSYSNEYSGVISIPDSVLYNGNYYTVTSISEYAFYACGGLTSITIPNSVTSIGDWAFYNCSGLTLIILPSAVTLIGNSAFSGCTGLTSIAIPNLVTSIGNGAFAGCTGLTSIAIPNLVTSIGNFAFQSCNGLTSINVDLNNIRYSSINGVLFNKVADTLIRYPMGKSGSYLIPNSVTSIGSFAFSNCSGLTSIIIPNSVTSIGDDAFWYCSGLTSINIPNSVTLISSGAFSRSGLTSITLPNFITSIGSQIFLGCSGLTSITIPNSVNSIGFEAFKYCTRLTSINIPNSVISIGDGAFYGCRGLTTLTIGNSVTSIGDYAFYGCSGLTSITLPYFLTSIGNYAFRNCTSLNTVFFNAINCDTMGSSSCPVFMGCNNFRTLKIGDSVQSILNYTFKGCSSITSLISNSINPPIIQSNTFYGVSTSIPITVPCNSIQNYQSSNYWNNFINYRGIDDQVHTIYAEICQGEAYNQFGFNESNAGFYTQNFQTTNGCDSIVNLNLMVNPIYNDTIIAEICSNETYTLNGFNENTTGFYTQNLQTTKGCDSIVNLTLIVNPVYLVSYLDNICKGYEYNNYGFNFIADTSGIYTRNYQTINGCDSIINLNLIVNPIYNDTIQAEICNGETYNQFGFNENTTGFYTQNLQTTKGCDSIVHLNLILNPTYNDTITAVICNREIYNQFGFNENTTGFYTQNLQTIKGCDSIVNLSLIVNPTYLTNHYDTICKGQIYSNYGFNFTADTSGLYTQNLQTIKGCDSIINLNLIVNPIYNDTITAVICSNETYNQFGFNENVTGLYTQNLQTINGCDSIVNLSLIVNPIYNDTIHAEICNGETYNQFGFNENTTGFYTQNLQTIKGCDSIVNLSLIVNPIYNDTITAIICQGYTYTENGFNKNTTGFYTQNLQTINGCDSIVNLSLTVTSPPNIELNMVTVDNNNNNVVIWNKDEVVNHYNVYREGNVAGQYDLIATVLFDSVSMFVDTNSNPTVKAYMYKISTTDTCLNESELSPFHKTMHLTIGQGMGSNWNLNWTPYVGANYSTYNIFRGINTLDSLQFLTTISSSNTSYTDINVPSGYVYYQIEIIIDTTTSNKASGINSIRSNYATNNTNSINDISSDNITIKLYPNPTNNKSKLEVDGLKSDADIIVSDLLGRVIKSYKINPTNNELEIDVNGFAKGVYNIRIMNDSINQTKKLIVQ